MNGVERFIDLHRYPIYGTDQNRRHEFVMACRNEYLRTGLCELPDFLLPDALEKFIAEANQCVQHAWYCQRSHNAYLHTESNLENGNSVENRMESTYVGSVAFDKLENQGPLKTLYGWDPLKDFIGDVLGISPFYRLEDPLGACSINVFVDDGEHGWHFDESEYTVTVMLQSPESGGEFEYAPLIRGLEDEREIVGKILNGDRQMVVKLPFRPGTLLIFGGKNTLHRVVKVSGNTPRLVPVLCFAEQPGVKNSESVRRLFWGRAA